MLRALEFCFPLAVPDVEDDRLNFRCSLSSSPSTCRCGLTMATALCFCTLAEEDESRLASPNLLLASKLFDRAPEVAAVVVDGGEVGCKMTGDCGGGDGCRFVATDFFSEGLTEVVLARVLSCFAGEDFADFVELDDDEDCLRFKSFSFFFGEGVLSLKPGASLYCFFGGFSGALSLAEMEREKISLATKTF